MRSEAETESAQQVAIVNSGLVWWKKPAAYQSKGERENRVHASSSFTVRDSPLCCNDRLDDCCIDDTEEERGGVQSSKHIGQTSLSGPASHNLDLVQRHQDTQMQTHQQSQAGK